MKIAILGTGRIAQAHAQAINLIGGRLDLAGCFDINQESMDLFARQYNTRACAQVDQLLDLSDFVIIATPNNTHYQLALNCLQQGKDVLCEKPMALTALETKNMCLHATRTSHNAYVGFNYRYLPIFSHIRELYLSGEVGELISVKFQLKRESALKRKIFTWRDSHEMRSSSGALGDLGVHFFDAMPYIFNDHINLHSINSKVESRIKEKGGIKVGVDDYAYLKGQLNHGGYFEICVSKSSPEDECGLSVEVIGSKLELRYHSNMGDRFLQRKNIFLEDTPLPSKTKIIKDPDGEFFGWADSFYHQMNSIAAAHPTTASFVDGHRAQLILEYILASHKASEYSFEHEHQPA